MLSQPSPVSGLQNVQMLHCARQTTYQSEQAEMQAMTYTSLS